MKPHGDRELPGEIAPVPDHNTVQSEPAGPGLELGGECRGDGIRPSMRLEKGREDEQAAPGPIRLEIDAGHDAIAEQERQDVRPQRRLGAGTKISNRYSKSNSRAARGRNQTTGSKGESKLAASIRAGSRASGYR